MTDDKSEKSLFKKAQDIRNELIETEALGYDLTSLTEETDIPEDERASILNWIEQSLHAERKTDFTDEFSAKNVKRGALLPILVNAAGILIVAASILFFYLFYRAEEQEYVSGGESEALVQNRIFEALKAQSEQQLKEKENEISNVQEELVRIKQEREMLVAETGQRLAKQERDLRDTFDREVSALRDNLEAEGTSESEAQKQLDAFTRNKQSELDLAIENLRNKTQEELAALQEEITQKESEYRLSLEEAQNDIALLQEQADSAEDRLRDQTAIAADELHKMREDEEEYGLYVNTVAGYYGDLSDFFALGDMAGARKTLGQLSSYVASDEAAGLAAQNQMQRNALNVFNAAISQNETIADIDIEAVSRSAVETFLESISTYVIRGEAAYRGGKYQDAEFDFTATLSQIPSLKVSYERLLQFSDQRWQQIVDQNRIDAEADLASARQRWRQSLDDEQQGVRTLLESAEAEWQQKLDTERQRHAAEITQLRESLAQSKKNEGNLQTLVANEQAKNRNITAQSQKAANDRNAVLTNLRIFKQEVADEAATLAAKTEITQIQLINLLQTKLNVREVLESQQVAAQFPSLADDQDAYYEAIRVEQSYQTELNVLNSYLDKLDRIIRSVE